MVTSSSKIDSATRSDFEKVSVFAGLFAALGTRVDEPASGVAIATTAIKLRIRCFDVRTLWYSHQSNK